MSKRNFKVILILIVGIFVLFYESYSSYTDAKDYTIDDIQEAEFTFKYDEPAEYGTDVYVLEQSKPLHIPSVIKKDQTLLDDIETNTTLIIGYTEVSDELYDKEIVYIYNHVTPLLTLEQSIADRTATVYLYAVICTILGVILLITLIVYAFRPQKVFREISKVMNDPNYESVFVPPIAGIERIRISLVNNRKQFKEIVRTIPEHTIQFYYLKEDLNNESAILFFRIGQQLVVEYLYYDDNQYSLDLINGQLEFNYPDIVPMDTYEFESFKNALTFFTSETGIKIAIED